MAPGWRGHRGDHRGGEARYPDVAHSLEPARAPTYRPARAKTHRQMDWEVIPFRSFDTTITCE